MHEGVCKLVSEFVPVDAADLAEPDEVFAGIVPHLPEVIFMIGYTVRWDDAKQEYRATFWNVEYASGIKADKKIQVEYVHHAPTFPAALALCEFHQATGTFPEEYAATFQPPYKLSYSWDQSDYIPVH